MKIKESGHGISIHDLPYGLAGNYGTDVVLPDGQNVYLQGASLEAHRHLQRKIAEITRGVPSMMSPQLILRCATNQYVRQLMETAENAA